MIDLSTPNVCDCGAWKKETREECHECDPSFIPTTDGAQTRWEEDLTSILSNNNL